MATFDITEKVIAALGSAYAPPSTGLSTPSSVKWDCTVGGIPFLFAIKPEMPMRRQTAQFRKDRLDTARDPGEQSLDSGLWLRSQSSWHYGSGISSAEPLEIDNSEAAFRYSQGGGVNPWTPGQLTLLNSTSQMQADAGTAQLLLGVNTGVIHASGTTLRHIATDGTVTAITWGGSVNSITSITSDGTNWYAANSTGIYKGALPSGAGSKVWDTGSTTQMKWVKSRLMATVGVGVYELTGAGPTLPTALDVGTGRPSGWTWTDISEGPTSIYLSGYVSDLSTVEKVGVSVSGSTITLAAPVVVAEMPRGELIYSLYSYVGSYLVLGTSSGVRVASVNTDGTLTLGPLTVGLTGGSKDAVASGSFLYCAAGSYGNAGDRTQRGGLWRIDLGQNLSNNGLLFANAADLTVPSGTSGAVEQVTIVNGTLWMVAQGSGVYKQSTSYVTAGWLETGRIRMGTMESKAWRDMRLLGAEGMSGSVYAYASLNGSTAPSTWDQIITISSVTDDTGSLSSVAPLPQPNLYVAVKLTGDGSYTPTCIGYQVRATPAPRRTELIQVPLQCFDTSAGTNGPRFSIPGFAWLQYQALKQLEADAGVVAWVDYTTGERAEAVIEEVSMLRNAPPTHVSTGAGGVINLTLRLV